MSLPRIFSPEWFQDHGKPRRVRSGEMVITAGVHLERVFLILEGQFEVLSDQLDASRIPPIGPGELLGEMSYLEKRTPHSSVRALIDGLLMCVRCSDPDAGRG